MRFLHTSDWHVGKSLRGRNRHDEHRAVLAEIVDIAGREQVDAVLIAGDLYDSSVPSPDAQQLVVRTLLDLRDTGADVIAVAGNHDNARSFDAYQPLMQAAGITMLGGVRRPDRGGVHTFTARSTGELVRVALLPFLSQRYAVKAADLIDTTPDENAAGYEQRVRDIIAHLTAGFAPDAVNILMSHLTVVGGELGGGERSAQSVFEYWVSAAAFPSAAHYVALGHLHRRQTLPATCPIVYSGSPLALDFGEQQNTNVVCLVEATLGIPASVTDIPITAGRRLRTVRGTVAEILQGAEDYRDDLLRVYVREPTRAGLREELIEALPNALEVRIDPEFSTRPTVSAPRHSGLSPEELFANYCKDRGIDDQRMNALFTELHDELTTAGRDGGDA